jgi:hypothetical protein
LLTPFFGKTQSKRDKEKQLMKNRVWSTDWRKNGVVNEIRQWSEEFSPDSGPAGQSDRPMASQRIGWWQARGSADGHEEDDIQGHTLDRKYGGGRSAHDWRRVKSQFLEGLRLRRESFTILVVLVFRCK